MNNLVATDTNQITLPANKLYLKTGDILTLKADNGLYIGRVDYGGGRHNIEAAKKTGDRYCQFKLGINEIDKVITLQADNGHYLSRVERNDKYFIEAHTKEVSNQSYFRMFLVYSLVEDKSYLAFDSLEGSFLGRVDDGGVQNIQPVKHGIEKYGLFEFDVKSRD